MVGQRRRVHCTGIRRPDLERGGTASAGVRRRLTVGLDRVACEELPVGTNRVSVDARAPRIGGRKQRGKRRRQLRGYVVPATKRVTLVVNPPRRLYQSGLPVRGVAILVEIEVEMRVEGAKVHEHAHGRMRISPEDLPVQ